MRLRATRSSVHGVGAGLPVPALRLDLTTEAAIDALQFSRLSGATRIAADGTFQWARENLCRYTDGTRWENAVWVKSNTTITNSAYTIASGPLAGAAMGLLSRVDAVSNAYAGTAALGGLVSRRGDFHASVVVRATVANSFFAMRVQGTYPARIDAKFNVVTGEMVGVVGTTFTDAAAWSVDRGDGCWELHVTGKIVGSSLSNLYFGPTTSGAAVSAWETAGATNPVLITRPQLNSGTGTEYYEAQASMRFMPRMKRDWQGNILGLWCEPAVTQLISFSESNLGSSSGVVVGNAADFGDFQTCTLVTDSTSSSKFARAPIASVTAGQIYTFSGVLHAPAGPVNAQMVFAGAGFETSAYCTVSLDGAGGATMSTVGAGVRNPILTKLGGGRWFVSITATANSTSSTSVGPIFGIVPAANSPRLEVHSVSGLTLAVSCPQFVQAEEWSSYVPTYGITGTRAADVAIAYGGIGPELVVDGGFPDGTAAWTPASTAPAITSISGGVATLTADGTNRARLRQNVAVQIGKTYRIRCRAIDAVEVWIGSSSGFTDLLQLTLGSGIREGTFTATTTMASITLTTVGQGSYRVDDVSLREAAPCDGYNQAQGTLVAVAERNVVPSVGVTVNRTFAALFGGSSINISLLTGAGVPSQHRGDVILSGASQAQMVMGSSVLSGVMYALGLSYAANQFHVFQVPNGQAVADSSGSVPVPIRLEIGQFNSGAQINGAVKRVLIFNRPLTPAQLAKVLAREAA